MSRGAYKQYEFDPGICIPKSTMYNKRKRQIETEQEEGIEVENIPHGHGPDHEDLQNEDHLVSVESETNMFANEGNVESDTDGNHEVFDHCMRDENINAMEQEINSDEDIQDTNQPIYPGANVTKDQSLLLILCFMLRHKLTEVALKDLLVLLNTFFPDTMPSTKHRFYKSIKMENSEIHFYCPLCKSYLGKDTTQRSCESCGSLFSEAESMKNGHYFIYIPVQQQIEAMLFNDKLYEHLTNRDLELVKNSDTVNDITTSSLYKELIARYGFTGNDISLTWNTDGIPVFNSSKYSIWPLQASLNELPPHLRAKNILLVGLWFGDKPNMNTFLKPFVKECSVLQEDGFLFSHELNPRKVFPLLFCGDAPARAMVRNSKQFNGCYGCDWCESPGVTVPTNGPPARYYPHRTPVVQRTAQKQAEYALQATPKEPIKGVKGITVVDLLPTFETVRGVVTDYMHSVCQGVTRHMVNLWVDTKHHNEVYYIGRKVPLVDQRLQQISPPSEIHRAPRSLSERRYWKASEWRAFLFYSLVILQGNVPFDYERDKGNVLLCTDIVSDSSEDERKSKNFCKCNSDDKMEDEKLSSKESSEVDSDSEAEEDWERHEVLHDDVDCQGRTKERLYENKIELKWEKGGSGLVFYTDAAYWDSLNGDFDEQTVDDWDIDMGLYEKGGTGDRNSKALLEMRIEEQRCTGNDEDTKPGKIGGFEKHTKGFGGTLMKKQGWTEGESLGSSQPGITEPIPNEGQHPRCKKGFGYYGEKLERHAKRRRIDRDVVISTVFDKLDEKQTTPLQSAGPFTLKYRNTVEFVPQKNKQSKT